MGHDRLSNEEAVELLDQGIYVLKTTQEIQHSTRNLVKLAGAKMGEESPLYIPMAMWPRQIDRFDRKYDKGFAEEPLF